MNDNTESINGIRDQAKLYNPTYGRDIDLEKDIGYHPNKQFKKYEPELDATREDYW